jgi:nitroreductase
MFSENFQDCWRRRYGFAPDFDFPSFTPLLRHRSVRSFSPKPVSEDLFRALLSAAQSASTSSNLQLWSVITVQGSERREAIAKMCANYDHVRQAPWFMAFLVDHNRLRAAARSVGENARGLDYAEFLVMALVDVAIAAERFACAAETEGLGVCYIGALRNDVRGVSRLLKLPKGVFGAFGMCLGYPADGIDAQIKPRLGQEQVWFREEYPKADIDVSEYDERMKAFYESEKMKGEVTWSMRSGRRVDGEHMSGREILKAFLEESGFNLR